MAIADYQSEADEDAQAREREETKRLLYVALTRARDRLYLSAACRTECSGRARQPGRGAAGDREGVFVKAAAGDDDHVDRPERATARDRGSRDTLGCEPRAPEATGRQAWLLGPAFGPFLGLFLARRDEDDRTVGLAAAVAGDPGDPVRTAGFGVNLVTSRAVVISRKSSQIRGHICIASGPTIT